jgi:hypothetical protein
VRAAYMLGLHLDPPRDLPLRERESRKRLWWTLYVLDSKVGMKLGRPFLLRDSSAAPALPGDDLETAMQSGSNFAPLGDDVTWLSFHLHNIKLFAVTREAYISFYEDGPEGDDGQTVWEEVQTLEAYAELLRPYAKSLEEWVDGVPCALKTKRQANGRPFSTDCSALDIEPFAPVWLQRQRLLLELTHHTLSLNMHRPFISFVPARALTPLAKKAAETCAAHAIALTHITHQVLSSTSLLDGWHEIFQWQWNAAMTLVGFVLAYPQSESALAARNAMDLAGAVFDIFGRNFTVAASAASILRDLSIRVDFLREQGREKQLVTGESETDGEPAQHLCLGPSAVDQFPFAQNSSELPDAVDSASNFVDLIAAPGQDVFDMALAIELWGDLEVLWPNTGGELSQFGPQYGSALSL